MSSDTFDPNPACLFCRFWHRIKGVEAPLGQCRVNAPKHVVKRYDIKMSGSEKEGATFYLSGVIDIYFPVTQPDVWCGQFKRMAMTPAQLAGELPLPGERPLPPDDFSKDDE